MDILVPVVILGFLAGVVIYSFKIDSAKKGSSKLRDDHLDLVDQGE